MKKKLSKIIVVGICIAIFISLTIAAGAFEFDPGHIVIYEESSAKGIEIFPSPNDEYFHKVPGETGSPWEKRFMLPGDSFVRCFTIKNEGVEPHLVRFYTYAGESWDGAGIGGAKIPSTTLKLLDKIDLIIKVGGETGTTFYDGPMSGVSTVGPMLNTNVDVSAYGGNIRNVPVGLTKELVTVLPGQTVNVYTKVSLSGEITNQDVYGDWSDHGCRITWVFVVNRPGAPTYTPPPATYSPRPTNPPTYTPSSTNPPPPASTNPPPSPPPSATPPLTPRPTETYEEDTVPSATLPLDYPDTDTPTGGGNGEEDNVTSSPPPLWPPRTGDDSQQLFYLIALLFSATSLAVTSVVVWRRRNKSNRKEN